MKKVFIGADHRGFKIKGELIEYMREQGYEVIDKGAHGYDAEDDYPDFAIEVAEAVAREKEARGVVICGSSNGVAVAANKVNGIFATQLRSELEVEEDIAHHDSNVLALSADLVNVDDMKKILLKWLSLDNFEGGRHKRRLDKIFDYERDRI